VNDRLGQADTLTDGFEYVGQDTLAQPDPTDADGAFAGTFKTTAVEGTFRRFTATVDGVPLSQRPAIKITT